MLSGTAVSVPNAEQMPFLKLLQSTAPLKLGAAVTLTMQALRGSDLLGWPKSQVLIAVLRDCVAAGLNGSMSAEIKAVVRNRMKRRFRELLREALPVAGLPDHDHVLIGREGGVERDFTLLRQELAAALVRAAEGKGDPPRKRK